MDAEQLQIVQAGELNAVTITYVTIGFILIVLWFVIAYTKMPKASDAGSKVDLAATLKRLIKNRNYVWGVIAQLFYGQAAIGLCCLDLWM